MSSSPVKTASKFVQTLSLDGIKAKEKELWGTKKPYFRVSDIELILIQDLADLHGLQFHPTSKDTKIAQINELRVMIQQRKTRHSSALRDVDFAHEERCLGHKQGVLNFCSYRRIRPLRRN